MGATRATGACTAPKVVGCCWRVVPSLRRQVMLKVLLTAGVSPVAVAVSV